MTATAATAQDLERLTIGCLGKASQIGNLLKKLPNKRGSRQNLIAAQIRAALEKAPKDEDSDPVASTAAFGIACRKALDLAVQELLWHVEQQVRDRGDLDPDPMIDACLKFLTE